ncbi:hypothetical protein V2O64_16010 [Verrucomicrobiaceae bacterium 227]
MSEKPKKNPLLRLLFGFFKWLTPIRSEGKGSGRVLIYTCVLKEFYLYLFWLPAYIMLGLNSYELISDTATVWLAMGFAALSGLVIVHDLRWKPFFMWLAIIVCLLVLSHGGQLSFWPLSNISNFISAIRVALPLETLALAAHTAFSIWAIFYLWSVTFRKAELGSNRRTLLKPFGGRTPVSIVGMTPNNDPRDVMELLFGASYDLNLENRAGRIMHSDEGVIGLWFYRRMIHDIISRVDNATELANASVDDDDDEGPDASGDDGPISNNRH